MSRCSPIVALLLALLLAPPASGGDDDAFRFRADNLPRGWRLKQTILVPKAQLAGLARRLGAEVVALENQVLDVGGIATSWNRITAADEDGARRIASTMLGIRGKDFVTRDGRHVYEVKGTQVLLARAVFGAAGYEQQEPAVYDVTFRTALVDEPDYTLVNPVFNHFLMHATGEIDEAEAQRRVTRDTADWSFGKTLRLRASSKPAYEVEWSFEPAPASERKEGATILYTFGDVPTALGLPYVDVKARIVVPSRFHPTDGAAGEGASAATGRWPAAPVARLASSAVQGIEGDRERALALLGGLHGAVGYGGAVGSRDPVTDVLARGHARCWDKTDVYIAMCRSVGLPARQVAGWVPALGAGHVWCEVHLAGEGWLPVDPTTPWLGTGTDYVPFFLSVDGAMPFVYLRMPQLKLVEGG